MTAATLSREVRGGTRAPVLLLGCSLGTDTGMWRPQLDALATRFRVVAFDHRGHGGSEVPPGPYTIADLGGDVLALADDVGADDFDFAGVSLGGMVGMWLAATAPARVRRLAVLCASARLGPAPGYAQRAAVVRRQGTAIVADAVVARWFTPGFAAAEPDVVARHRRMLLATPAEGYAGCCEAIAAMDLRACLPRIAARTLVVAGADDEAIPPAHARAIRAAIGGSRMVLLDRAAHLANVEQADAVTGLLLEHLAGAGADASPAG